MVKPKDKAQTETATIEGPDWPGQTQEVMGAGQKAWVEADQITDDHNINPRAIVLFSRTDNHLPDITNASFGPTVCMLPMLGLKIINLYVTRSVPTYNKQIRV